MSRYSLPTPMTPSNILPFRDAAGEGGRGVQSLNSVVIPTAGLGTRLGTLTNAVSKNLAAVGHKTLIDWAIQEAMDAGAENVVLIVSPDDLKTYQTHFYPEKKWEAAQDKADKLKPLEKQMKVGENITFVVQEEALGLGHAILQAKEHVNDEQFGVILPDDLIIDTEAQTQALSSMVDAYQGGQAIARMPVSREKISSYGAFDFGDGGVDPDANAQDIVGMVEKPKSEEAPSNYAAIGRYILTRDIWSHLEALGKGAGNEYQLTDAIEAARKSGVKTQAVDFDGMRFDCGNPEGLGAAQTYVHLLKTFPALANDFFQRLSGPVPPMVDPPSSILS